MMNLDKKKLIVIAIVLASILAGILIYMLIEYERVLGVDTKNKNIYEVQNNNSFVVKYGDYIYYVPENKAAYSKTTAYYINKFLENDIEDEVVGESAAIMKSLEILPNIKIYDNKLFAVQNKKTYKIEMPKQSANDFCDGELQYIGENHAITLSDGNLYNVPYFEETFMPQKYKKVVNGNCIYLYEDDDALYYCSSDNNNMKTTVFSISKNNFQVTILLELKSDTKKLEQIVSNKKYVYCLVSKNDVLSVYRISQKNNERVEIDLTGYYDVSMFTEENKDNVYFYASQNNGEKKIYVCSGNATSLDEYRGNVKDEHIQLYSVQFDDNEINLYKNGLFFIKFDVDINNLTYVEIKDIAKINDFIYYKIYYTNSKNLEITEDMYNTRYIDTEDIQSGDNSPSIEKTIIVRISTDGKIVQKLK